jgi:hypothetical protein
MSPSGSRPITLDPAIVEEIPVICEEGMAGMLLRDRTPEMAEAAMELLENVALVETTRLVVFKVPVRLALLLYMPRQMFEDEPKSRMPLLSARTEAPNEVVEPALSAKLLLTEAELTSITEEYKAEALLAVDAMAPVKERELLPKVQGPENVAPPTLRLQF